MKPRRPWLTLALAVASLAPAAAWLAAAGAAASEDPPPPAWTSGRHALSVGGVERSFLLDLPEVVRPGAALVLVFHGYTDSAEGIRRTAGFTPLVAEHGFVAVYPNGTGAGPFLTFNSGGVEWSLVTEQPDDVAFVSRLLDDLATVVNVDPKRVFATGMSNGAMMAYRAGAELADTIASIAPVAGPLALASIAPARPVPVLHFHGSLDQFTPLEGGVGRRSVTRTHHRGVVDGLREWARHNGLDPLPVTTPVPCADEGITIERVAWGGPGEAEVVLYRIDGGGHTWPGMTPDSFYLGTATRSFEANPLILDFFRRHPRPA